MQEPPEEFEVCWLREIDRRIQQGLPLNSRAMMVELRDQLPKGFVPRNVDPALGGHSGITVRGLMVIGDSAKVLPDVERAIYFIRDQLIEDPSRSTVAAFEVADALQVEEKRAERILGLISNMSGLSAGGSGSSEEWGLETLHFGRDDVIARYLAFTSLTEFEEQRAHEVPSPPPFSPLTGQSAEQRSRFAETVFVLMNMDPRDPSLEDVLEGVKEECAAFGLIARRIDEIEHADRITDRILDQIAESDLIFADLTGERPNVYYEVGYAHALGKRPILFRREGTRLHFDLAVHNVPEYANVTDLRKRLHSRLEAVLGRSPRGNEE